MSFVSASPQPASSQGGGPPRGCPPPVFSMNPGAGQTFRPLGRLAPVVVRRDRDRRPWWCGARATTTPSATKLGRGVDAAASSLRLGMRSRLFADATFDHVTAACNVKVSDARFLGGHRAGLGPARVIDARLVPSYAGGGSPKLDWDGVGAACQPRPPIRVPGVDGAPTRGLRIVFTWRQPYCPRPTPVRQCRQ